MAKNLLNSIKLTKPNKNLFDLTHDVKLTANMGNIVPILAQEAVPGDQFKISGDTLVRFAPLLAPVMHRYDVSIHYFFVPNRLVWSNWGKWISGEATVTHPYINYYGALYDSNPLIDYLGLPRPTSTSQDVSALPFAAYQAIYNEYYRDQNLINEVDYKLLDGNNTSKIAQLLPLRKRAWEHDYFTSALPWAQKGNQVQIPIGNVSGNATVQLTSTNGHALIRSDVGNSTLIGNLESSSGGVLQSGSANARLDPNGTLEANTNGLTTSPTSINDLRRAFRLQEWLEKNARAGTRYVETILAHFGVRSSDARLQRPEYITGVKTPVVISEVLNTTGEDGGLPQGNMSGHGVAVGTGYGKKYFCEEHGYIIGVLSVLPLPSYQQGIPKHFLRQDKFDYFWPEFANIGEQPILNKELYVDTPAADQNKTFGYTPRYSEYKFATNRVCGDFRTSLNYWHSGRIFSNTPALNQSFVECQTDDRIFAVVDPAEDKLYIQVLNKISALRPMPKYGTPTF